MSYDKGARGERELIKMLDGEGFVGLRAPSSGSTTERELPDILVGKNGRSLAIEAKRIGDGYKYLPAEEIEALYYFARHFGAEPWIAARYDYGDWFFVKKEDLHQTNGGNFRIEKSLSERSKSFDEIVI